MNSNQENNQFGPGSKIDKKVSNSVNETERQTKHSFGSPATSDDDFLSGDNKAKYHPDLDQYEFTTEDEDRYNNGASEHDDFINDGFSEENTRTRYSGPSRNGSHRNH